MHFRRLRTNLSVSRPCVRQRGYVFWGIDAYGPFQCPHGPFFLFGFGFRKLRPGQLARVSSEWRCFVDEFHRAIDALL